MSPDLQQKLFAAFPTLYRRRSLGQQGSCLAWGITCGDGWFDLVWGLSAALAQIPGCELEQVKEKWGALTVHLHASKPGAAALCNEYRLRSMEVCEQCGGPGRLVDDLGAEVGAMSWLTALCPEHEAAGRQAWRDRVEKWSRPERDAGGGAA
jgi:hypothetical protein